MRLLQDIAGDASRYSHLLDPTPEGISSLNAKNEAEKYETVSLFPLDSL